MEEGGKEAEGRGGPERIVAVIGDGRLSSNGAQASTSAVPPIEAATCASGGTPAAPVATSQAASGPVAANKLIARRYANPNEFQEKDGKVIPLAPAFRETRPGGISVDVLWIDGGTKQGQQRSTLTSAANVASAEGHQIRGWFSARVKTVLEKSATANGVVHSPTASNPNHADIVSRPLVRFADDWDEEDKRDAVRVIAKDLAEVFREHGNHLPKPEQPTTQAPSETTPE